MLIKRWLSTLYIEYSCVFLIKTRKMRKTKSHGLFDEHFRLEKISKIKDPLTQLNQFIRWEDFRPVLIP